VKLKSTRVGVRYEERTGARSDNEGAPPLYRTSTAICRSSWLEFADSHQGGAIAIDPNTGEVSRTLQRTELGPKQFTGGISVELLTRSFSKTAAPSLVNKEIAGK